MTVKNCSPKEITKKVKTQLTEWEKILTLYIMDRRLYF